MEVVRELNLENRAKVLALMKFGDRYVLAGTSPGDRKKLRCWDASTGAELLEYHHDWFDWFDDQMTVTTGPTAQSLLISGNRTIGAYVLTFDSDVKPVDFRLAATFPGSPVGWAARPSRMCEMGDDGVTIMVVDSDYDMHYIETQGTPQPYRAIIHGEALVEVQDLVEDLAEDDVFSPTGFGIRRSAPGGVLLLDDTRGAYTTLDFDAPAPDLKLKTWKLPWTRLDNLPRWWVFSVVEHPSMPGVFIIGAHVRETTTLYFLNVAARGSRVFPVAILPGFKGESVAVLEGYLVAVAVDGVRCVVLSLSVPHPRPAGNVQIPGDGRDHE